MFTTNPRTAEEVLADRKKKAKQDCIKELKKLYKTGADSSTYKSQFLLNNSDIGRDIWNQSLKSFLMDNSTYPKAQVFIKKIGGPAI